MIGCQEDTLAKSPSSRRAASPDCQNRCCAAPCSEHFQVFRTEVWPGCHGARTSNGFGYLSASLPLFQQETRSVQHCRQRVATNQSCYDDREIVLGQATGPVTSSESGHIGRQIEYDLVVPESSGKQTDRHDPCE